jgi:hypothetical protein
MAGCPVFFVIEIWITLHFAYKCGMSFDCAIFAPFYTQSVDPFSITKVSKMDFLLEELYAGAKKHKHLAEK